MCKQRSDEVEAGIAAHCVRSLTTSLIPIRLPLARQTNGFLHKHASHSPVSGDPHHHRSLALPKRACKALPVIPPEDVREPRVPAVLLYPLCDLVSRSVSQTRKERKQLAAKRRGPVLLEDDRRDLDRRASERGTRRKVRRRECASEMQGADEPWVCCSSAALQWCPPGGTPIVRQCLPFTMMTCPSDGKREKASTRTHLGLLNRGYAPWPNRRP